MSGHSKWSTIKRKKGTADAKRGKIFSRLSKAITIAAQQGKNLDTAITAAKASNMPKDNIDRAIKKGTGELGDGSKIESITFEIYGPGGSAILVNTITDNRNRTVGELKAVLNKFELKLAEPGSVLYLFDQKGMLELGKDKLNEDVQLELIDAGAADIIEEEDRFIIYSDPSRLSNLRQKVEELNLTILDERIGFVAKMPAEISPEDQGKLLKILDKLDDLDDADSIETNANLD